MKRLVALLVGLSVYVAGCASSDRDLRVFVAASLVDVARDWQADAAGQHIEFTFHGGGSSMLARQIAAGARADFLIAAGPSALEQLGDEVIPARVDSTFLSNRLVIVTRSGLEPPTGPADLVDPRFERIAIADPALAPAGSYAQRALEGAGIYQALAPRIIVTGDVRMALAAAAGGSVDVALVYATDAATAPELSVTGVDAAATVHYPLVMLPPCTPEKSALWDYLHSDAARAVARRHGFDT